MDRTSSGFTERPQKSITDVLADSDLIAAIEKLTQDRRDLLAQRQVEISQSLDAAFTQLRSLGIVSDANTPDDLLDPDFLVGLGWRLGLPRAEVLATGLRPILELAQLQSCSRVSRSASATVSGEVGRSASDDIPVTWLQGWPEIVDALNRDNSATFRERLRNLNESHDGPIIFRGQGTQPVVDKAKLIAWWNGLYDDFQEREKQRLDSEATVSCTHAFGRSGEVVPEIGGSIKARRSGRKK